MPNERKRIARAFAAIRKAGGVTVTGQCCQGCSWAEASHKGAKDGTTVAIHHRQGTQRAFAGRPRRWNDPGQGQMVAPLHVYHGGDSRLVCEALRAEGLTVEWGGSEREAIVVLPDGWRRPAGEG